MSEKDIAFLKDVDNWPCFASVPIRYCCLKRGMILRQQAFIIEGSWDVCLGHVQDGGTGESIVYDSPEAIVEDGWLVD